MGMTLMIAKNVETSGLVPLEEFPSLCRHYQGVDWVLSRAGVATIESFMSADPDELRDLLEATGIDPSTVPIPPQQFFNPVDGLKTVREAMRLIEADRELLKGVREAVIDDLRVVAEELEWTKANGGSFYFYLLA